MSKIPSTLEMDKIFTAENAANRHFVMKPCRECGKYSKQDIRTDDTPCPSCGGEIGISSTYWMSLRTFRADRKITAADKKKMGA